MAIDTTSPRTRRAILLGALGGVAASVAAAVGRASSVSAADGQAVVVGGEYTASSVTKFDTQATTAWALWGISDSGIGVVGDSTSGHGIYGGSSGGVGVEGNSSAGTGVKGATTTGVAVRATGGSGRGGVFSGNTAQLRLVPSTAATHPSGGQTGDLFVDKSGRLWLCKTSGTPAIWRQVSLV